MGRKGDNEGLISLVSRDERDNKTRTNVLLFQILFRTNVKPVEESQVVPDPVSETVSYLNLVWT